MSGYFKCIISIYDYEVVYYCIVIDDFYTHQKKLNLENMSECILRKRQKIERRTANATSI